MTDVFKGSTSHTYYFELVDSTTGLPQPGILYTDVTGSYVRSRAARTAITMATLASASAAWPSGGFILVDDTNQPGVYRFDIPDAAFATGVDEVIVTVKATGCRTQSRKFSLVDINNQVAYAPNAAANANGGLPILSSSGTTLGYTITTLTTYTGNTPQTGDVYAIANGANGFVATKADTAAILVDTNELQTDWANGGRLDVIIDSILVDTAEIGAAGAGLTALATAANLATVAGYLDTEIAAILADTNELQTDWVNGGRLDLILDARSSQTSVDDVPTNAELATALGAADDATLTAIAALNNLSAAQVTTAATAATPVVTISGTLTTLDAIWNKIKAWLGALAGKTADTVTRAEINATTAGAGYNETTDSQESLRDNYTTGGDTLIVSPIVATQPTDVITNSGITQAFRYTPLPSGPLVIVDADGDAIDLSTSDLKMICRNVTVPSDTFELTLADGELAVSGAGHNYISVAYTPTVAGRYERTTFRKVSGGSWTVIEIGEWQIEDSPNPA